MVGLPTGVVTFLFSDVEGSTRLLQAHPTAIGPALERHHRLLSDEIEAASGVVFETVGDAVYGAFALPADAIRAAIAIQRAMAATDWGEIGSLRVRIAVHSGPVQARDEHYFGAALFEVARLQALAHGGQTLATATTTALAQGAVEAGIAFTDLGRHRLKDLQESLQVFQVDAAGLPTAFPPLRGLASSGLPGQMAPFRGRQAQLVAISRAYAGGTRIVTLTGPAGAGKTRLAISWAASAEDTFPDGAAWVDVASTRDPAAVLPLIAAAVGAGVDAVAGLERWRGLLLLDNLEQVVEAAGDIARLLRSCPGVTVLATSREPLRIAGERVIDVPGLDRGDAIALFRDQVTDGAAIDVSDDAAISAICELLDDQPLAIQLAAARTRALSVRAIRDRLGDRLGTLSAGGRDAPDRHRSLRAAISWSYELLAEPARDALVRLAVFVGGWTTEAADAVCGVDVDTLAELVDKSLVRRTGDRYDMLQAIHEYAADVLAGRPDRAALEIAHGRHYAAHGAHLDPGDLEDEGTYEYLADDGPNLLAALERATARGDAEQAWAIVDGSWRSWLSTGQVAAVRPLVGKALAIAASQPLPRGAAEVAFGHALDAAGELARWSGDSLGAIRHKEGALEIARRSADQGWIASLEHDLAWIDVDLGRPDDASRHADAAIAIGRELGDPVQIAHALDAVAGAARARGELRVAETTWRDALAMQHGHEASSGRCFTLLDLADTVRALGDLEQAATLARDGLRLALQRSDVQLILCGLEAATAHALSSGNAVQAAFLLGALERRLAESGLAPNRRRTHETVVASIGAHPELAPSVEAGRAASVGVVVERAMTYLVEAADRAASAATEPAGATT